MRETFFLFLFYIVDTACLLSSIDSVESLLFSFAVVTSKDEEIIPPRDYSVSSTSPDQVIRNFRFARVENSVSSEDNKSLRNFYGVSEDELPALVFINGKSRCSLSHLNIKLDVL